MEQKMISLPKLNQLQPTLESTALKLMEEAGELAQAIGKYRGLSGEKSSYGENEVVMMIAKELLEAVSMMYVLEEDYQVDLNQALSEHVQKLVDRGYLQ